MKTQNLFFMLILISMAFSFISCTDEDDKVEIPQLVGKWIVKEPVLQDDFVTCYTFNADKTYEVYTGSPLSNGVPFRGTYIISLDEKLIKLYDKEEHCTEQYHILKLTSKEMKWENASPKDGNSDKRLETDVYKRQIPMSTSKKKETYSQAMERLEKIVRQIDNNELEIDALAEKIKEANEIIAFCSDKLTKADKEIEKLLSEKWESEE